MRFGSILILHSVPLSLGWSAKLNLKTIPSRSRIRMPPLEPTKLYSIARGGEIDEIIPPNSPVDPQQTDNSLMPSWRLKKWLTPHRLSVGAVLAAAYLNLLGFTMAGPITPALGQHFGLKVGASFGSLTSAYPLGMLIGLFLWPQLSDRIGRKPVMAGSLFGSGLGLAAQAYVIKAKLGLGVFLATRVFTGSFAGSSPVSKAYLADVGAKQGKLPRYLALRDAASTMAFIVGPVLGGVAYDIRRRALRLAEAESHLPTTASLAFVIGVSAVASLAAAALVSIFVTEVPPVERKTKSKIEDVEPEKTEQELVSCPLGNRLWAGVASVCLISFLFNVGDSTFHAFWSLLLKNRLGFDARSIGLSYTVFACLSFSVSATLSSRMVKLYGAVRTCAAGLSIVGTGLLGLAAGSSSSLIPASAFASMIVLGSGALYCCGVPLYGPTIPTMLLQCVPTYRRGAVMGLDGAINTLGRVIAPLLMGELYRLYGPVVAFGLSGTVVLSAAGAALLRRYAVVRKQRKMF